jgi:hypothetical protein
MSNKAIPILSALLILAIITASILTPYTFIAIGLIVPLALLVVSSALFTYKALHAFDTYKKSAEGSAFVDKYLDSDIEKAVNSQAVQLVSGRLQKISNTLVLNCKRTRTSIELLKKDSGHPTWSWTENVLKENKGEYNSILQFAIKDFEDKDFLRRLWDEYIYNRDRDRISS